MSLTGPMLRDFARAPFGCPHVFLATLLAATLVAGCGSRVQNVSSTDVGGGVKKGDPPMCFQYRSEARPTSSANNIWVHVNNTCSYTVDCMTWDSVSDQEHRMMAPQFQTRSYLVAIEVPDTRVEVKPTCTWKP
jgi:hypothetical protein